MDKVLSMRLFYSVLNFCGVLELVLEIESARSASASESWNGRLD